MALLPNGYNPQSLQDVFNQVGASQSANLTDQYTQARKQAVAGEAASGRLTSGVSNYPLTDLDTSYQKGLSDIQTNLAGQEAGIQDDDWLNNQNYLRQYGLADAIGNANRPSTLEEIFAGIGSVGSVAGTAAGAYANK